MKWGDVVHIGQKYVVLDVETNGLSSLKDDLLCISIYKPDDGQIYNRFLPLELSNRVFTTHINGITESDLEGAIPLTQNEVMELIQTFELDKRIVLTFGSLDEKFIRNYFRRKHLYGYEKMSFYNFKKDIISSRFSGGNVTKDNLCRLFGIDGVKQIHTGTNDCILEWELFKKIYGKKLLITGDKVFEMNEDYIIPVSYLGSHPNLRDCMGELPNISYKQEIIKKFEIYGKKIKKFPTNFNGMILEHLINSQLKVNTINSLPFLYANKSRLKYIGKLPSAYDIVPMSFNEDGTVTTTRKQDAQIEMEINRFVKAIKKEMKPMIQFIAEDIFHGQAISSQELVVHPESRILALCDLSTQDTVMEIKTNHIMNIYNMKEQLYYESNGRECYLLQTDWSLIPEILSFVISKVTFSIEESKKINNNEKRRFNFQKKINNENISVVSYVNSHVKVRVKCKVCAHEWDVSCATIVKNPVCPFCNPKEKRTFKSNVRMSEEEKRRQRELKYQCQLTERSNGTIKAYDYTGAKNPVYAECIRCGHRWKIRSDHLLNRAYCPICKKKSV